MRKLIFIIVAYSILAFVQISEVKALPIGEIQNVSEELYKLDTLDILEKNFEESEDIKENNLLNYLAIAAMSLMLLSTFSYIVSLFIVGLVLSVFSIGISLYILRRIKKKKNQNLLKLEKFFSLITLITSSIFALGYVLFYLDIIN